MSKKPPSAVAPVLIPHEDVARLIGVPRRTILEWAKSRRGAFPAPVRVVGRTYLFNRREVEAYAKARPPD